MKVGLFFGSFNPIHVGHLLIAEHMVNFFVDQVWFVVSPLNPFKNSSDLLDVQARILMVGTAIKNNSKFKCSDVELNMPVPSYTIDTLQLFKEKYADHLFSLIVGYDNFVNIETWKNGNQILRDFQIFVYKRSEKTGYNKKDSNQNITIVNAPLIDISSTEIRNLISQEKSIRYLVTDDVLKQIIAYKFYDKQS